MSQPAVSMIRQNYHTECEAAINKQINIELHASYVYKSLSLHFDREDVALPGFCKFFKKSSDEERGHAELLMKYQNQRGGRVVLQAIDKPEKDSWGSGLEAMQAALALERTVNQCLLDMQKLASTHGDPHLTNYIEEKFLDDQVDSMRQIAGYITNLKRVGPGMGEYLFDKETLDD
jgi:ferritin heavy chain